MDPFTITAISMGISALGTGTSLLGGLFGADDNAKLVADQQKAENIKFQQQKADWERSRRQDIRKGIYMQHQAVAAATAGGANESTGAYGAYGQVNQETGWNVQGVNMAQHFGTQLHQANMDILADKGNIAQDQSIVSMGQGLSSLGGAGMSQATNISNLTGYSGSGISGLSSSGGFGKA